MNDPDPGTPTWLRTHNDRTAFRLLLDHGPLSRSQLGELSGMSKPTAGQMLARLEQVGLVAPAGETVGARGPNAVVYGVRRDAMTGVAVSVLAHAIHAVLTDPLGSDHPVAVVEVDGVERSPENDVRRAVEAACEVAGVSPATISVVVVGVQGAVDARRDALAFTDTLPGWPEVGARARIEQETGAMVIVENDVNLAAIAERAAGVVEDADGFAYLWLGDGVGMALDIAGHVQRGHSGGAGEIGYLPVPRTAGVDPTARDFTDLLGRAALVRLLGADEDASLSEVLPETLADHPALDSLADRVALLAEPVLALVDPGIIILGGPTGVAGGPQLADRVRERIDAQTAPHRGLHRALPRTAVHPASVTDQPILVGARNLLVAHIRDRLDETIAPA